jgi:hypothetical protein
MSGVVIGGASAGRSSVAVVLIDRNNASRRGPVWELRPVCCGSIWYIGLPIAAAARGTADGEATVAGRAEGAGDPAATGTADAAGEVAGRIVGGATEDTG